VNQGDIPAGTVEVTDFIPDGMTLSAANTNAWAMDGPSKAKITLNDGDELVGPIMPGQTVSVEIILTVDNPIQAGTSLTNFAEISEALDVNGVAQEDEDSTPNDINDDLFLTDNDIDGMGSNGGDEDDSDPAEVTVLGFDLALNKTLHVDQAPQVNPGATVVFTIKVVNQGQIPADSIEISDYLPTDMTLNDAAWTEVTPTLATRTLTVSDGDLPLGGLLPGDFVDVNITVDLSTLVEGGTSVTNFAEISGATDETGEPHQDTDSNLDSNPNNDNYFVDNDIDGIGINGGDEDDHDPEAVLIGIFDLALYKTLAEGQSPSVNAGSEVTFTIHVINQGEIAADNIQLVDYVPAGLTLNDSNWTLDPVTGYAYRELVSGIDFGIDGLEASTEIEVDISFIVDNPIAPGIQIDNFAEIASATDTNNMTIPDIDSTPNDTQEDDILQDNEVDGNGSIGEDEDDHDIASLFTQSFDLALIKRLAQGQATVVQPNDIVTFDIRVFNQGDVIADNITVTDYIPTGMTLVDTDWMMNGANAEILLNSGDELPVGGLLPNDFVDVSIDLQVGSVIGTNTKFINEAEVSSAEDENGIPQEDADSSLDDIPGDEYLIDDYIDGNGLGGDDEDDSDQAEVCIQPRVSCSERH